MAQVIDDIESQLRFECAQPVLDRRTVEALDIVSHALAFSRHPRALELWRDSLWKRELAGETREALAAMLDFLTKAAKEGRGGEISQVCDCLHLVLGEVGPDDPLPRESHDAR